MVSSLQNLLFRILLSLFFISTIVSCSNDGAVIEEPIDKVSKKEPEDDCCPSKEGDGNDQGGDGNDQGDDGNEDNNDNSKGLELAPDFILNPGRRFVNFILPADEYYEVLWRQKQVGFKKISQKVYEHFDDVYDFMFILQVEDRQPWFHYYGISAALQGNTEGIGGSIYNHAPSHGSANKLKCIISMLRTEYIVWGPSLHEITHYWGNFGFIDTQDPGHWGHSSIGGQLGGFDELRDLGNNTYQGRLKGRDGFGTFGVSDHSDYSMNSIPYGNAELYIMGLIGIDELNDIQVAVNPRDYDRISGRFDADEIKTLTPSDIVELHGPRIPNVADSQKEFKAITVVLSKEKLSKERIDKINLDLENFSREGDPDPYWENNLNFWKATQRKATMSTKITGIKE